MTRSGAEDEGRRAALLRHVFSGLLIAAALLCAACETTMPGFMPEITEGGPARHGVLHPVQRGQTLWRIARAYHVPIQQLAEVNDLADPTRLDVGLALWIPGADRILDVPPARSEPPPPPHARGRRWTKVEKEAPPPDDEEPKIVSHHTRFIWPLKGPIASRFGVRNGREHDGIDIDAPAGTPIVAADGGEVLYAGTQHGYGNLVLVRHTDNLITVYAHNAANRVKTGDRIRCGAGIAIVGQTGRATGPHLHFEVRQDRVPRNPLFFLP